MKNLEENFRKRFQEFKVFNLKKLNQLRIEQIEFFEEIRKERGLDDLLTVIEALNEYQISRSTFDRWRMNGLKVYQKSPSSAIRVKRKDLVNYLNNK